MCFYSPLCITCFFYRGIALVWVNARIERSWCLQTVKHVHPDKLSSSSVRDQLLGSMVFNLLNEAFKSFKSFEGMS